MAYPRNRSRHTRAYGSDQIYSEHPNIVAYDSSNEYCEDVVGNKLGVNTLFLESYKVAGSTINGSSGPYWQYSRKYSNYPSLFCDNSGFLEVFSDVSDVDANGRLLSSTNPSRPDIQLPVFFFELKDLPKMIRHAGSVIRGITTGSIIRPDSSLSAGKQAAAANLAIQFGWAPFLSDLGTLLSFQSAVERRRKEINRLYSGRGLSRKVEMGTQSDSDVVKSTVYSSFGMWFEPDVTRQSSVRTWGTIRWSPNNPSALPPTDRELWQICTGLTAHATLSNLWEAMPWSWLIDWFTNLGDVIQQTNNSVGAHPHGGAVMREHLSSASHGSQSYDYSGWVITLSGGSKNRVVKTRMPALNLLTPSASFPELTGNQLSILGSLVLTRL